MNFEPDSPAQDPDRINASVYERLAKDRVDLTLSFRDTHGGVTHGGVTHVSKDGGGCTDYIFVSESFHSIGNHEFGLITNTSPDCPYLDHDGLHASLLADDWLPQIPADMLAAAGLSAWSCARLSSRIHRRRVYRRKKLRSLQVFR